MEGYFKLRLTVPLRTKSVVLTLEYDVLVIVMEHQFKGRSMANSANRQMINDRKIDKNINKMIGSFNIIVVGVTFYIIPL